MYQGTISLVLFIVKLEVVRYLVKLCTVSSLIYHILLGDAHVESIIVPIFCCVEDFLGHQ